MGNLKKQQVEELAKHLEDAELQAYEVTKITSGKFDAARKPAELKL